MTDAELLQEIKDYLRIDDDYSDMVITPLIQAGKDFIKSSTGREFSSLPLEMACLKMLMSHWYDGETKTIPFGVQSLLRHLELE